MKTNITYKDSVFSFLFSDPDTLRELYCALEGIELPPDTPVVINTLTDVLFRGRINDISFTVDNRLVVLIEHQSTINPNMPLRLLMYIARIYEKITDRRKIYTNAVETIPAPEFIVLYNGIPPYPEQAVLRLSQAFRGTGGLQAAVREEPSLELSVRVYNINKGQNAELAHKSRMLDEYSSFVAIMREEEQAYPREEALGRAMKRCVEYNILKVFLETHGSEVMNMLDWDIDEAKAVWYEEGREEEREEIARNALAKGIPLDMIHEITGLDMETIESLKSMQ